MRAKWNNGTWGRLTSVESGLYLALSESLKDEPEQRHVTGNLQSFIEHFDVAPLRDDRWLAVYREKAESRAAIYDESGRLMGTATFAGDASGPIRVVPLSPGRALVVTQRYVWEAPYSGVNRGFASVVTTEAASRRRTSRP